MPPLRISPFLISLLLSGAFPAHAQLLESDTVRWQVQASSSLYLNQGNVDRLLWRNGLMAKHLRDRWGVSSRQQYLRGTFSGFKTENDWLSTNFLYYNPKQRFYPYVMAWMETNLRRRIGFRYQVGSGGSWRAWQSAGHLIKISLTGTYELTRYDAVPFPVPPDGLEGRRLGLLRLTGRLWGQHRLAENLFFQYEYWWQQAFRQAENHRWLLDSQLKTGLKKGLSAVASLLYTYEPFVPEKVRKRDLFFTFGLQYGLSVP